MSDEASELRREKDESYIFTIVRLIPCLSRILEPRLYGAL